MTQVTAKPFDVIGNTSNIAVTASNQSTATSTVPGYRTIRICNIGTQTIFVQMGKGSQTASTITSFPVLANSVETFYWHQDWDNIAFIAGSTGSTAYWTFGEGS